MTGRKNRRENEDKGSEGARLDALMAQNREKRRESKGEDGM